MNKVLGAIVQGAWWIVQGAGVRSFTVLDAID